MVGIKTDIWNTTEPEIWRNKYQSLGYVFLAFSLVNFGIGINKSSYMTIIINLIPIIIMITMWRSKIKWQQNQRKQTQNNKREE